MQIDPVLLNPHYAAVSFDSNYQPPDVKLTCCQQQDWPSEESVFWKLDKLKLTGTGLDGIPAWFLKVTAPLLAEPVSWLYRHSLYNSIVPTQWKTSCITPIPKISQPANFSDFRPISITPILSRLLERFVVSNALYPLLETPDVHSILSDQYAFRPTGSTTAALIHLLHDISNFTQDYPYVHVFALDFSKAFDTVRHHTLLSKYDSLHIDDNIQAYNWLVECRLSLC